MIIEYIVVSIISKYIDVDNGEVFQHYLESSSEMQVMTEWFDYYMKHDYLYYNCLKNCEEIKEEWEKLHKDVIQDIQNNVANNVEKICGNFLDGF